MKNQTVISSYPTPTQKITNINNVDFFIIQIIQK